MIDCAGRPGGVHFGVSCIIFGKSGQGPYTSDLGQQSFRRPVRGGKKYMPSIAFHYTNLVEAIRITATCVVGLVHEILNSLQSRLRISS